VLSAWPVRGRYRRLRTAAYAVLIAILLGVPWIRIGGEPLVWLDLPGRKFHVFGVVIFPQELFLLWLLLAGLALALFFFTALAGRLWCGWACPQTVFTDLFAAIARALGGAGRAAGDAAWWRVAATHAVWLLLSAVIGFHLVGYFVPPADWIGAMREGDFSGRRYAFFAVTTALAYFDFGIVRQTFCKYLCPYARFQGVLFDRETLVIGYDPRRGEPRGKLGQAAGDCVDCGLCVRVCPTEIDIRRGLQLECIACTQCIDACDGVMARVGRARGLIDYRSLSSLESGRAARVLRPRVVVYGALLAAAALAVGVTLERRVPFDLQVERNAGALTATSADGRAANAFTLHVQNRDRRSRTLRLRLEAPDGFELLVGENPFVVPAIDTRETRVFVLADPRLADAGPTALRFELVDEEADAVLLDRVTSFVSPRSFGGVPHGR
jgi:cytochrome c oxidase accessory protein FixG